MPESAQELTTAATEYEALPDSTPTQYAQKQYTATLLAAISKANTAILSTLFVTIEHNLSIPIPPKTTLARLADLGARDPDVAHSVFLALWAELTAPDRPPVLFTLDGLAHTMKNSAYRSMDFELIHAHDLALIGHFTSYLSGTRGLPNGGAIVAATSKGNSPLSPAMTLAIKQAEERSAGVSEAELSRPDPFAKLDERSLKSLQGVHVLTLKGLSKDEARGLMEYWAASGVLRQRVDEKTVTERWTIAGMGIVGEIERGALRMRM